MVSYLVPWLFSLFWAQCTYAQSNRFYHPFYPDVTHVRKDTRPSPALPYCKRRKAGRGLGTRLVYHHVKKYGTVLYHHGDELVKSEQPTAPDRREEVPMVENIDF